MPRLAVLRPYLTGLLIAVTLLVGVWTVRGRGQPETLIALEPLPEGQSVTVFVGGAVARPGVYTLPRGDRVEAAIAAAGGLSEEADPDAVNRAGSCATRHRLSCRARASARPPPRPAPPHPPRRERRRRPSGGAALAAPTSGPTRVNVNTAPVAELERLPGVGPRLAQQIIDYRTANGPFATPADLAKVRGISDKMVEGWGEMVTCGP